VIVKSRLLYSKSINEKLWAVKLKGAGYEYTFFDGLNRYYLHASCSKFKELFKYSNTFRETYISKNQLLAYQKIKKLESEIRSVKDYYSAEIQNIKSSISWNITKPLRVLHNLALKLQGKPYFSE
jgi:hypothetical protein